MEKKPRKNDHHQLAKWVSKIRALKNENPEIYSELKQLIKQNELKQNIHAQTTPFNGLTFLCTQQGEIIKVFSPNNKNIKHNFNQIFNYDLVEKDLLDFTEVFSKATNQKAYFEFESEEQNAFYSCDIWQNKKNQIYVKFWKNYFSDVQEQILLLFSNIVFQNLNDGFSNQFVKGLSKILHVPYVFIGRLMPNNLIESVAFFVNGKFLNHLHYTLKGTPCEHVYQNDFEVVENNVIEQFPEDEFLVQYNCSGYVGVGLYDGAKKTLIGHLAFLTTQRVKNAAFKLKCLQIIAPTIASELKKAISNQNLAQSESKFRVLSENLPGVVYLCKNDKNYSTFYINDNIKQLTGYSKNEFLEGKIHFAQLIHPKDQRLVRSAVNKAVKTKRSYHIEYRIISKSQQIKWLKESGVGVYVNGQLDYLEGYMHEVTAEVENKIKIRENNKQLQLLANTLNVGLVIHVKGKIRFVNDNAKKILGYTKNDIVVGSSVFEFIHPDYREISLKRLERIIQNQKVPSINLKVLKKSGGYAWIESVGGLIDYEGEQAVQVSFIDITEKFEAQQLLSQSELKFRGMFENAFHGMIVADENAIINSANKRFCQLLGYKEKELVGKSFKSLTYSKDQDINKNQFYQLKSGKISNYSVKKRYIHKSKKLIWVSVSASLIKLNDEKLIFVIVDDISDLIANQEKLAESRNYLNQVLESPKDLLVFSLDKNFNYLVFNTNHAKFMKNTWGKKIEVGQPILNYITVPELKLKAKKYYLNALKGVEYTQIEQYTLKGQTKYFEVFYSPFFGDNGKIQGITCFVTDITTRRKSEIQTRENEQLLASINRNIQEGIYRSTPNKGIIYVNEALVKMFGYQSKEEIIQTKGLGLYANEDVRDELGDLLLQNNSYANIEVQFKRKDGSLFWGLMSGHLVFDEETGDEFFDGAIRNITKEKKPS